MLNRISIMGRLVADPELRAPQNGLRLHVPYRPRPRRPQYGSGRTDIKHNRDERAFGRRVRPASVSDVFILCRSGEKHAHYTDSIGFRDVDKILTKTE